MTWIDRDDYEQSLADHHALQDEPLDVWLRIPDGEEESEAEANTFRDDGGYRVEWYLTSVGLVKSVRFFATYDDARAWLERAGFEDFTS